MYGVIWDVPPSPMGERLKEEIELAKLDKDSIVKRGIVSRQQLTTMLHGSLDKVDGADLKKLATQGIDLNYVFTGIKMPRLAADEAALLDNYRNTMPKGQASLQEVGTAFAEPEIALDADGTYEDVGHRKKW